MCNYKKIEIIGIAIIFIGLLIGLGDLLGWFEHPERSAMVKMIERNGEIPSSAPNFEELLSSFPPESIVDISIIVKMRPTSGFMSQLKAEGLDENFGEYWNPVGPLVYCNDNNKCTRPIITFEELKEWSKSSIYPWLSWILSAIGFIVTLTGTILAGRGVTITKE
ncbi:MAG: hypothetical protein F9K32_03635 [Desulfobulbaceae bacterium]|nr:MAG: hypothetical protein F9K32_03635 [Desulfobulbaceae bacterium]